MFDWISCVCNIDVEWNHYLEPKLLAVIEELEPAQGQSGCDTVAGEAGDGDKSRGPRNPSRSTGLGMGDGGVSPMWV